MALSAGTFAAGRRAAAAQQAPQGVQSANAPRPLQDAALPLERYEPKSMLHVPETHVPRSRFPVIDFHTHITFAASGGNPAAIRFSMDPANCLAVMDRKNIRTMVSVTGSYGDGLREAIAKLQTAHPGRFAVFTEPVWSKASDAGYAKFQADQIADAHQAGAKGLKVLKTLGLFLREQGSGKLVRIDDPRFDPMWEAVGSLKMPVAITSPIRKPSFCRLTVSTSVGRNCTLTRTGPSMGRIFRAIAICRRRGAM